MDSSFRLMVVALMLATSLAGHVYDRDVDGRHAWKQLEFVSTSRQDGQEETRVAQKGLLAMETVVSRLGEHGIFLREITNGKVFVQLIYQNRDILADCDIVRDPDDVDTFVRKFFRLPQLADWRRGMELEDFATKLGHGANSTYKKITAHGLDDDLVELVDFDQLKWECKDLHREIRRDIQQGNKGLNVFDKDANVDALKQSAIENGSDAPKSRSKRSMLIYPGTNWCGRGSTAKSYYDLGENIGTDKCCRAHDFCEVTIEGFTEKFNYFNYRFTTLSHCECDDMFHTCLKTSDDDVSKMIGKLFFNVIGNKCFVIKDEKVCAKRSWWGKCIKYKSRQQAEIRSPLQF